MTNQNENKQFISQSPIPAAEKQTVRRYCPVCHKTVDAEIISGGGVDRVKCPECQHILRSDFRREV